MKNFIFKLPISSPLCTVHTLGRQRKEALAKERGKKRTAFSFFLFFLFLSFNNS